MFRANYASYGGWIALWTARSTIIKFNSYLFNNLAAFVNRSCQWAKALRSVSDTTNIGHF